MTCAALIIDMQADFFADDGLSRRRGALIERINDLVATCRRAGAPVVWVKQEWADDLSDAMLDAKRKGIRLVIAGTPGAALLAELDHRPGDPVIVKKRYSAFFGTNLDQLLGSLRAARLIVAGINTHACVRTTVIDAYQRDYEVILARDCIDSHDREHHDISWKYMDGHLGRGMGNEEIRSVLATPDDSEEALRGNDD